MTCPEPHSQKENLTLLKGQALPPAQLGQPAGPRVQELEGGRGASVPTGCFALLPVTVPQRGSLTRVGLRIPQPGLHWAGQEPQLPSLHAPEQSLVFSQRGPSEGSWSGEWAGKAYFRNSWLVGGPREKSRGFTGGRECSGENLSQVSASGWPWPLAGTFQGELEHLPAPWEQL